MAISSLIRGERTGSHVAYYLWSYVSDGSGVWNYLESWRRVVVLRKHLVVADAEIPGQPTSPSVSIGRLAAWASIQNRGRMYVYKTDILCAASRRQSGAGVGLADNWYSLGNSVDGHCRNLAGTTSRPSLVNLGLSHFLSRWGLVVHCDYSALRRACDGSEVFVGLLRRWRWGRILELVQDCTVIVAGTFRFRNHGNRA